MIDGRICRAARGYLNWTSRNLSSKSGVPVSRIFEFERDRPIPLAHCRALETVFSQHGIEIVTDGSRATGIRESAKPARAARGRKTQLLPEGAESANSREARDAGAIGSIET